ncbi:GYD domain-containing protein [Rhodobacteraceae bacterium 2CG4]|uniref:GYD domain-containing protein n=1 Tax=Halovulum marinum TaxID=2662447 RepID=A0A6L5YVG7_9RHOB|nr:GYD domain-containing protein [Halovulum marinum]MSU88343.1 GYD domain-containing protein [Halovulum marinum]
MTRYLTQFRYSSNSVAAMVKKPQDRRAAAEKLFGAAGGEIECMYFCFGEYDGLVITEFPTDVAAASALLAAGSSGAFSALKTTVLIPNERGIEAMEAAGKVAREYTPPTG